ncbi:unnamed protein product [Camellia sinensis]
MASYQFINHSNNSQVRNFHSGDVTRGRSKSLMRLHTILRTISSFPPPETPKDPSPSSSPVFDVLQSNIVALRDGEDNRALFDIDLNLGLDSPLPPPLEAEKSESLAGVVGEVAEIDSPVLSVGECDLKETAKMFGNDVVIENGEEAEIVGEKTTDISEITTIEVQCLELNSDRVSAESVGLNEVKHEEEEEEAYKSKGSLDLLIEAAKLISGEFEDDETERNLKQQPSQNMELSGEFFRETKNETAMDESSAAKRGSKRRKQNECWIDELYGDFEDVSPVVRSNRGRNQVLPHKYRDSVLEPLKPLSRHRSSAAVSTKRRSRKCS